MRYDIEASKSIAFKLSRQFKSKVKPSKKTYNKPKERRKNKIKLNKEV